MNLTETIQIRIKKDDLTCYLFIMNKKQVFLNLINFIKLCKNMVKITKKKKKNTNDFKHVLKRRLIHSFYE